MAHRVSLLVFVTIAVVLGACSAQPTAPRSRAMPLHDTEEPECVDTIYEPARASASGTSTTSGSTGQTSSTSACHVVIVYY